MKSRSICLSISKRNEDMVDVIDEYADMLGMSKACAVCNEVGLTILRRALIKYKASAPGAIGRWSS